MNFIEISSLPKILFSHIYKADAYQNHFSVRDNFLEISYIADGSFELEVGNKKYCAKKGDVICFLHNAETILSAKNFHCHHTVGATVNWNVSTDEQVKLFPKDTLEFALNLQKEFKNRTGKTIRESDLRMRYMPRGLSVEPFRLSYNHRGFSSYSQLTRYAKRGFETSLT